MPLEMTELGLLAAEFIEQIEEDYGAAVDVELGIVAIVAEVKWTDDSSGDEVNAVTFQCSDGRRWIQRAIFREAESAVLAVSIGPDELLEDDEDE